MAKEWRVSINTTAVIEAETREIAAATFLEMIEPEECEVQLEHDDEDEDEDDESSL